jgi:hypothetical protein
LKARIIINMCWESGIGAWIFDKISSLATTLYPLSPEERYAIASSIDGGRLGDAVETFDL